MTIPNETPATPTPATSNEGGDTLVTGSANETAQPNQQDPGTNGTTPDANKPADGNNPEVKNDVDGDKADKDGKPAQVAPEKYEDFSLPEGVSIDAPQMEAFQALAKQHNLSQEAAQAFAELGAKLAMNVAEKPNVAIQQALAEWKETSKNDTEFGGAKLDENLATAKKTLDTFGTPELRTLLVESGLGNHAEVIRLFYRIGQKISEDGMFTGEGGATRAPQHAGDVLYGKTSNKST